MAASDLAHNIVSAIQNAVNTNGENYDSSTPASCQQAIANAISSYIIANTQALAVYSGVTPAETADPVVSDMLSLIGSISPASTSGDWPSALTSWLNSLIANMCDGLSVSSQPGENGIVVSPAPPASRVPAFITRTIAINTDDITNAMDGSQDSSEAVWTKICEAIFTYINSTVVSGGPAVHTGVSTGAVSIITMSIT